MVGSTVNLASRIGQLNKAFKTDILISAATFERVRHLVRTEEEPPAEVKRSDGRSLRRPAHLREGIPRQEGGGMNS